MEILLIEDNPGDARLVEEFLSEASGAAFDFAWADRLDKGLQMVAEGNFDVVLLDLELPDSLGLPTAERVLKSAPDTPAIVMTSLDDKELAISAVKKGAQDYLVKGFLEPSTLVKSINYAIERQRAQKKLRESELMYRTLFEQSPDAIIVIDFETGLPMDYNEAACLQFGCSPDELSKTKLADFTVPETAEDTARALEEIRHKGHATFETRHRNKDGGIRHVHVSVQAMDIDGRNAAHCIIHDITERKEAEEELGQSEARLARSQEIAHLGSWELDLESNALTWSDEVYRIFGLEPREFEATYDAFLEAVHPDDRAAVDEAYSGSIRDGRDSYEIEHRVMRKSGEIRFVHEKCEHIRDASGRIIRSVGMVHDITGYRQAEHALAAAVNQSRRRFRETDALLRATRSVVENQDFEEAARPIFEACKELIGATSGYVALRDSQGNENKVLFLDPGEMSCDVNPGLPMPIRGLRGLAYDSGNTVIENDFLNSEYTDLLPAGHAPLDNVMFAPLMLLDEPAGLLGLANKPGGFNQNDAHLVSAFTELMSLALANSQAYTSLEKSEERFRSITASASDAVISADSRSRIATWNEGARAMFGYTAEEAVGQKLSMLMPERFRDGHQQGVANFLATGEPRIMGDSVELMAMAKDGREFPIELSLSTWQSGGETYFGSIIRDITERRRLFEETEQARRLSEALNNISVILNSTLDRDEIMNKSMAAAMDALQADSSQIATEENGSLRIQFAQGLASDTPPGSRLKPEMAPVAALAREAQRTVAISDAFNDDRLDRGAAQRLGIGAAISTPILRKDRIVGVISFLFDTRREFGPAYFDFMDRFSNLFFMSLENAKLYETERETRSMVQSYAVQLSLLHDIGLALNRETDWSRLLNIVVESAANLTSAGLCMMTQVGKGATSPAVIYHAPWYQKQLFGLEDAIPLLHRRLCEMISDSDRYCIRVGNLDRLPWFPETNLDVRELLAGILRDARGRIRGLIILGDKAGGSSFSKTDQELVELLAGQSSVALISAENFEREHYVAETLQTCLLPEVPVRDDLEIGLIYRSASSAGRIGGDFYDIIELTHDVVAVVVGDVCGKGLSAASHTAMVKFMLRAYLEEGRPPGDCLSLLNNAVCKNLATDKFITLGLAVVELERGVISYALAGHPLPVISRGNQVIELDVPNTIPLGVIPGYDFPSLDTGLSPATSLLLYTDGVTEAKSPDGEQFGHHRLMSAVSCDLKAQPLAQEVLNRVIEFSQGGLSDDVALLVLQTPAAYPDGAAAT